MHTAHGRMLIAATLCCRGPKIEAAAAAVATADDKEFAKELYRNLVVKEKALLAIRDKLLEGRPAAFPPPCSACYTSSCTACFHATACSPPDALPAAQNVSAITCPTC